MDLGFLKNVLLFNDLSMEQLKLVTDKMHHVHYKEGDTIIKENEFGESMFILYKGVVEISKKMTMLDETEEVEMNKTFITLTGENHNFFGEIGLLCSQKRTASVTAKSDCHVYTIDRKAFQHICDEYPEIGLKIVLEIAKRLSGNLEKTNTDVLKLTTALIYALK
jgi:CRP-like cAMP-binding protein